MKYSICILLMLFVFSCKPVMDTKKVEKEITIRSKNEPSWLIGSWKRVGEKEGNQTYEYWRQNDMGEFFGMGCTLQDQDTIWKEDILLARDKMGWKFAVVGKGETVPTVFRVTTLEPNKFICENAENEFPKKIEYVYDGKNINAVISGGGPTIPFNFIRME